jgi:hypothetical protein
LNLEIDEWCDHSVYLPEFGCPIDKDEVVVKAYFTEAVREHRLCSPERG